LAEERIPLSAYADIPLFKGDSPQSGEMSP
jgi:hypothetical protein